MPITQSRKKNSINNNNINKYRDRERTKSMRRTKKILNGGGGKLKSNSKSKSKTKSTESQKKSKWFGSSSTQPKQNRPDTPEQQVEKYLNRLVAKEEMHTKLTAGMTGDILRKAKAKYSANIAKNHKEYLEGPGWNPEKSNTTKTLSPHSAYASAQVSKILQEHTEHKEPVYMAMKYNPKTEPQYENLKVEQGNKHAEYKNINPMNKNPVYENLKEDEQGNKHAEYKNINPVYENIFNSQVYENFKTVKAGKTNMFNNNIQQQLIKSADAKKSENPYEVIEAKTMTREQQSKVNNDNKMFKLAKVAKAENNHNKKLAAFSDRINPFQYQYQTYALTHLPRNNSESKDRTNKVERNKMPDRIKTPGELQDEYNRISKTMSNKRRGVNNIHKKVEGKPLQPRPKRNIQPGQMLDLLKAFNNLRSVKTNAAPVYANAEPVYASVGKENVNSLYKHVTSPATKGAAEPFYENIGTTKVDEPLYANVGTKNFNLTDNSVYKHVTSPAPLKNYTDIIAHIRKTQQKKRWSNTNKNIIIKHAGPIQQKEQYEESVDKQNNQYGIKRHNNATPSPSSNKALLNLFNTTTTHSETNV